MVALMDLHTYIQKVGRDKAAQLFAVTPGAISHWLNGRRSPSKKKAQQIVEATHGLVTYDGIYRAKEAA